MKKPAWMLTGVLALVPIAMATAAEPPVSGKAASAEQKQTPAQEDAQEEAEVAQKKSECKQDEQQKGAGEKTSAVVCAIKVMFRSRIRRTKESEPVDMTVGSPPMQTDDTDTPGPHNLEINIGVDGDLAGRERSIEAPNIDINYGIGDTVQLTYSVPYIWARQEESDASGTTHIVGEHGVGDSTVGMKYRFYDNKDTGLSFAIYPQVEFRTPGGKRAVSEGTSFHLPVIVTKEFEHFSIGGNLGVDISSGSERYFASVGVGKRLTENVALLAEIAGNNLNATDEKHVLLNVGLRRKIDDTQSISGSLGHDVYAGGDQREHTYFNVAYQKLFGK
jgi:hypothetical protein